MRHTATGYWIEEAGEPEPLPQLSGEAELDVLIVGGGFTGLWTAWRLCRLGPELRIGLLEAGRIGQGPSGRNGGFCNSMWFSFAGLRERYGAAEAIRICELSERSVGEVGAFCEDRGVDAWFRRGGYLHVSTSARQDGLWARQLDALREEGVEGIAEELDRRRVREICDSPRFRGGVIYHGAATVQPARLGLGLRSALVEHGVELFEHSPVRAVEDGPRGVVARTEHGLARAPKAVLATGGALAGWGSPVRDNVTVASSHMVVTEPVPDLLEQVGWTGGEAIGDGRAMLAYFRTTPDGRIAFGWGGGRIAAGGRVRGRAEVDERVTREVVETLRDYFPGVRGRRVTHAWGGPIDASPTHLPVVAALPSGNAFAAFGYTGNGVGPSQLVGRALASCVLDRRDEYSGLGLVEPASELARVPPEPFRWIGGTLIHRAIRRKERVESAGGEAGRLTELVASVPRLIGFHIGR